MITDNQTNSQKQILQVGRFRIFYMKVQRIWSFDIAPWLANCSHVPHITIQWLACLWPNEDLVPERTWTLSSAATTPSTDISRKGLNVVWTLVMKSGFKRKPDLALNSNFPVEKGSMCIWRNKLISKFIWKNCLKLEMKWTIHRAT